MGRLCPCSLSSWCLMFCLRESGELVVNRQRDFWKGENLREREREAMNSGRFFIFYFSLGFENIRGGGAVKRQDSSRSSTSRAEQREVPFLLFQVN